MREEWGRSGGGVGGRVKEWRRSGGRCGGSGGKSEGWI